MNSEIGVGCYTELYLLPVTFFRQILRMPLEIGSPPGFPEALSIYKKSLESEVWDKRREEFSWTSFEKKIAKGRATQFSHVVNRSGYHAVEDVNSGRYRAPVTLRTIVACSGKLARWDGTGRIPVLFYERSNGLLFISEPKRNVRAFTKNFVVNYLGDRMGFDSASHITPTLNRRYDELVSEGRTPLFTGLEKKRPMRKSDFKKIEFGVQFGRFIDGVLGPEGLDLEVAFLVPHIVVEDFDELVSETEEHLERLRSRGKV